MKIAKIQINKRKIDRYNKRGYAGSTGSYYCDFGYISTCQP